MARRTGVGWPGRAATVALAVVVALTSACSPPRVSRAAVRASPPSSVRSADGATLTPGAPGGPGVPAMLFAGPNGLAVSGRDRPLARTSLALPRGTWQATAAVGASPSGTILLVSSTDRAPVTAVVGQLVGGRVESRWVVALPASLGPAVLPGCVSGGRAVVIADALVFLDAGRVAGTLDVPGTVGRCQMLDDGAVAYLAEGDHAVSFWRPDLGSVVVTDTRCDDFAVGGDEMACLGAGGDLAIGPLVPPIQGGPAFAQGDAARIVGPARQVLLSPNGDWLTIVAQDGPVLEFDRLTGGRVVSAGGSSLPSGEALLGLLGP